MKYFWLPDLLFWTYEVSDFHRRGNDMFIVFGFENLDYMVRDNFTTTS